MKHHASVVLRKRNVVICTFVQTTVRYLAPFFSCVSFSHTHSLVRKITAEYRELSAARRQAKRELARINQDLAKVKEKAESMYVRDQQMEAQEVVAASVDPMSLGETAGVISAGPGFEFDFSSVPLMEEGGPPTFWAGLVDDTTVGGPGNSTNV